MAAHPPKQQTQRGLLKKTPAKEPQKRQRRTPAKGLQTNQKQNSANERQKRQKRTPAKEPQKKAEKAPSARGKKRPKRLTSKCNMRLTKEAQEALKRKKKELQDRIKDDVNQLTENEVRDLLINLINRMPGLVIDVLERHQDPIPAPPSTNGLGWSTCGRCRPMLTGIEEVCCGMLQQNCLANRPEMDLLVLDPLVLDIANAFWADAWAYRRDRDNKARRHDGYRQFTLWVHGRLGTGVRRVVPSCCVWRIRDRYPSDDNKYTGFKLN